MIARFHYDENVLWRLLRDERSSEDKEVLAHVERCVLCQDQLYSLSAGDMTWEEVCDLMRQDDLPDFELPEVASTTKPRLTATAGFGFLIKRMATILGRMSVICVRVRPQSVGY